MRLRKIIEGIQHLKIKNYKNYNIKSITHISKDVIKDSIFICLGGDNFDGNDYIDEALTSGAKCIVTERDIDIPNVTIIKVDNVRKVMSLMAKNFYNSACDFLNIIGVIGTSGKTSTTHIIKQILYQNGKKVGIIGTNGVYFDNIRLDSGFTTPDPLDLHYIFYQMKMLGVEWVIMEISAQAIDKFKMCGIRLRLGVFTNISPEHLDYFHGMEKYAKCKMDYFDIKNMDEAIINVDDFYGRELAYKCNMPSLSLGIGSPANVFALDIDSTLDGLKFVVNILDDIYKVSTKLVGDYNVYNIMSAMAVARVIGIDKSGIERAVNNLEYIDGRFNVYVLKNGAKVIVDFAHTVDSIDKLLSFVRKGVGGRLITLFGCVGYSNKEKRQDMMKAVLKYSDYVIISTDNRGDTPFSDIEKDMVEGVSKSKYISIEDRENAINFGFGLIGKNDTLVIMGKGAENFQKIGKEKIPYSDINIVQELIKKQGDL